MQRIIPYAYFLFAAFWFYKAWQQFQWQPDIYNLIFRFNTESLTTFIVFKAAIGILLILIGIKRLKMLRN